MLSGWTEPGRFPSLRMVGASRTRRKPPREIERREMSGPAAATPTPRAQATPEELSPRHLVIRVAEIAAVIAVVALAISALPGLDQVRARLTGAAPGWIVALALAEVGSCAGYLLAFRSTFCSEMSWRLSYDIAMAELAANSLLPAGGAGGLALGVWALRQAGMPTAHIARRSVAFFVVTSAANFFVLVIVGIGVFVGLIAGPRFGAAHVDPALITALGCAARWAEPQSAAEVGEALPRMPNGITGGAGCGSRCTAG